MGSDYRVTNYCQSQNASKIILVNLSFLIRTFHNTCQNSEDGEKSVQANDNCSSDEITGSSKFFVWLVSFCYNQRRRRSHMSSRIEVGIMSRSHMMALCCVSFQCFLIAAIHTAPRLCHDSVYFFGSHLRLILFVFDANAFPVLCSRPPL